MMVRKRVYAGNPYKTVFFNRSKLSAFPEKKTTGCKIRLMPIQENYQNF